MAIESFAAKTAVGRGSQREDRLRRLVARLLGEVARRSRARSMPRGVAHGVAIAAAALRGVGVVRGTGDEGDALCARGRRGGGPSSRAPPELSMRDRRTAVDARVEQHHRRCRAAARPRATRASRSGDITINPSTRPRTACTTARISSRSLCEPERGGDSRSRRAARSMPRMTSEKNSPWRSGRTTPMVRVERVERLRAPACGTYCIAPATSITRRTVSSRMGPF